jgi:hypothetical protein
MPPAAIRIRFRPILPASLVKVAVNPSRLVRVSGHRTNEPYFGKHQGNRFDDPEQDPAKRYGTSYFGENFSVALAETLLHDRIPEKNGYFFIELAVIAARYHLDFRGDDLCMADLTGSSLRRMGGHAGLCGMSSYKTPQNWSRAIHDHPDNVDGFRYVSRHLNTGMCYLVFDRAAGKITLNSATPLSAHPEFGQVATGLYINNAMARPFAKR